ncbi:hypothetical protein MKZ38_001988 [Zalerion maritima]|uniref:Uncharacterized protein n=1 Tax=Zalerion maritima TaxID=339359 RepID=A0AAD5RR01_9PEZI|nr:hypothetical protein MKZ38_001988 [Zalerion maritima]
MDMDIDMDDIGALDYEAGEVSQRGMDEVDATAETTQAEVPSEATTLVPNKVHITGLDTLSTDEIKAFVAEHYHNAAIERVEWINDTGANIIYKSESFAHDALLSLSAVTIQDASAIPPGEAIDAKSFSAKPDISLRVRFAVQTDKKQPGAWKRSRYYLFHPEADPEQRQLKNKYRDREARRCSDRKSYRSSGNRHEGGNDAPFDASFYDDDDATLANRAAKNADRRPRQRRYSDSPSNNSRSPSRDRRERNRDRELFTDRHSREATALFAGRGSASRRRPRRDRSLSPGRDRDADESMGEMSSRGRHAGSRNKDRARTIKGDLMHRDSVSLRGESGKELFPSKLISSGKSQLDQADEAIGKMSIKPPGELSIKGISKRQPENDAGISIKGRAAKSAKELFPDRFGENTGKELFADRLEGRGRPRRKAEDLFL